MNRFCSKCGNAINPEQRFCHICGNEHVVQGGNVASNNMQNNYQPYPNAFPMQTMRKPKHVNFLFVTFLVFMIFFAFRVITSISSLANLSTIGGALDTLSDEAKSVTMTIYSVSIITIILTLLIFGGLLTAMILSSSAKKRDASAATRKKIARILIIFSIVLLVLAALYTISEIVLLVSLDRFIEVFGLSTEDGDSLISTASGALVFDFTLIGFMIATVVKSLAFKVYADNQQ